MITTEKNHKYLTFSGLKNRKRNINKKTWKENYYSEKETVYLLHFGNFVKIGHTFRDIETRLYNYTFPSSSDEIFFYKDKIIDFKKSFILNTNIRRFDIKFYGIKPIESIIKRKFKTNTINESTEMFGINHFTPILNILNSIANDNNIKVESMLEYTGFKDSKEMKEYNIEKGIIQKATHLYSSKQKVKLFLNIKK